MFPNCSYQHITFTMPNVIWSVFKDNGIKLNDMIKIATKVFLDLAKAQSIEYLLSKFKKLNTYCFSLIIICDNIYYRTYHFMSR